MQPHDRPSPALVFIKGDGAHFERQSAPERSSPNGPEGAIATGRRSLAARLAMKHGRWGMAVQPATNARRSLTGVAAPQEARIMQSAQRLAIQCPPERFEWVDG